MPIYSYKCTACQQELDVLQKISDPPPAACPQCGAPALVKQLTAAGFQLKGSGWYATDFKNGPAKKDGTQPQATPQGESAAKEPEAKPGSAPAPAAPAQPPTSGKDAPSSVAPPAAAG